MHGFPEAGSSAGLPAAPPPDWPAPSTPLPGEEPTIELPVVTEAMLAADSPAVFADDSDDPKAGASNDRGAEVSDNRGAEVSDNREAGVSDDRELARPSRVRRVPALERRGPRPLTAPAVALDDLLNLSSGSAPDAASDNLFDHSSSSARPGASDDLSSGRASAGEQGRPDETGEQVSAGADGTEPGRRWLVGAGIAGVALLLTGATVVVLTHDSGPGDGRPAGWSPPVAAPAAPASQHTVTAALAGRTSAGFDLVDGAKQVTVRAADLGDALYRISTPAAGDSVPRADEQDGRVRLRLDGDAQAVDISLNSAVLWDLRVAGGAELSTIDLSAGRVGGVDLTGGASQITLTLPRPDGTLGVRMSGGVRSFDVRTAERTPVRVRVGRGAGQVTLNGQSHAGVAAGQTFTPTAWGAAVDRVDVDAEAGMSAMTVAPY